MSRGTPSEPSTAGRYVSQSEAAQYLGVSVRTIRQYISEGHLPAFRLTSAPNGLVRIRREDLDAMLCPIPTAKI